MSNATKARIVAEIAKEQGQSVGVVGTSIDRFLAKIAHYTETGSAVSLAGFGKFERRTRAARKGRNPKTGEAIEIAESSTLAFKASSALKS